MFLAAACWVNSSGGSIHPAAKVVFEIESPELPAKAEVPAGLAFIPVVCAAPVFNSSRRLRYHGRVFAQMPVGLSAKIAKAPQHVNTYLFLEQLYVGVFFKGFQELAG